MSTRTREPSFRLAVIGIVLSLMAGGAFADKPEWAGGGRNKEGRGPHAERGGQGRDDDRRGVSVTIGFGDAERRVVSEYYGSPKRRGSCPPGLAKKNNGCQPPGQAKMWHKGQPLARDIPYYELPRELSVRLPLPPVNHSYVRVAGDILLIATGTGMVVDAIEDILR